MDNNKLLKDIDPLHYSDIINVEHPSYFFTTDHYALLIIRFFKLEHEELQGVSFPFLMFKDTLYSYERGSNSLVSLDSHHSLHNLIQQQLSYNEQLIQRYIEQVDHLEDSLYTRKISPIFLDIWFDLKKDLTRIERIFERARDALNSYLAYSDTSSNFPKEPFADVLEHLSRYERLCAINSMKLDTLYNFYNSIKNDKINKNIYVLTIISGIFLPLNLIVGFFGMNTQNLFFSNDPQGTQNVIIIMTVLFITTILFFPLFRQIEHTIVTKLLGRFNIYTKIIEEIRKITSSSK